MSWNVTTKQYIPAQIGEPWGGGYFAGYISHTANGNPTHALIVAPRETGASGTGYTLGTKYQWKTSNTLTENTRSPFDGRANTDAIIAAGIDDHPAAKFCVDLNIGGYTDWYFPARYELDIAYFNLKPSTTFNSVDWGINIYSVPQRNSNRTAEYPTQTEIINFTTGSEAFSTASHWSSTEADSTHGWYFSFGNGSQLGSRTSNQGGNALKAFNQYNSGFNVRAFRRVSLSGYTTV